MTQVRGTWRAANDARPVVRGMRRRNGGVGAVGGRRGAAHRAIATGVVPGGKDGRAAMRLHLISDPASSSRGPPKPVGRPRVLVVDGDRPTRLAMTRLLRDRGADVRAAGTPDEARGALLEWDPDAVLLEPVLPDGGGGIALLEDARRLAPRARLAVVTAATDPALLDAARHAGPDLLRRKPVDFEELAEFLLKPR